MQKVLGMLKSLNKACPLGTKKDFQCFACVHVSEVAFPMTANIDICILCIDRIYHSDHVVQSILYDPDYMR